MDPHELALGVRTVKQIADYFAELKQSATAVAERVAAQRRGYFTPDEDDDTQALLVSYWQTRHALFDLICSMRLHGGTPANPDPTCFLVAFAGASLLVDAARFLREIVEHRPVVRNKLNEPVPQFNVPAGVYDTVQKSLLSTRHGWHLYHARKFYDEHRDELREVAAGADAIPLADQIERLNRRLDVTVQQFAQAKLRTRTNQLLRCAAWTLMGRALYSLQKLAGNLASDKYVRPGHVPQLPEQVAGELRALMAPGDVLVVRKEYALTNYFLPGYWPHAALFLGAADQLQALGIENQSHVQPRWDRMQGLARAEPGIVLESMKDGVHLRSLRSPFGVDSIVVLRPQLSPQDVARGIARVLAHENKPYDFDFDFRRADRLVCTEVVYRAFDGLGPIRLPLSKRAGRLNVSGGDLLRLALGRQQFAPIAVYAPGLKTGLIRDAACLPIIAAAERSEPAPA
jgi:hypothetical protein